MKRELLLKSKGYNITKIQNELFRQLNEFMKEAHMNRTQLAKHLGVSKGYVSQVLNGNFDFKLSKLVELSLAMGMIPEINFIPFEAYEDVNPTNKKVRLQSRLKSYSDKTKLSLVEEPDKTERNIKQDRP